MAHRKASLDGFMDVTRPMSDRAKLAIVDNPKAYRKMVELWAERLEYGRPAHPLEDKDALPHEVELLQAFRKRDKPFHARGSSYWPALWEIREGFNFQVEATTLGVPLKDWERVEALRVTNYEKTRNCRVLWSPNLVEGSIFTERHPDAALEVLAADFETNGLPLDREHPYGSASLVMGLIAGYYLHTSGRERAPDMGVYALTDTKDLDGNPVMVGDFFEGELRCNTWTSFDHYIQREFGCFPLIVLPPAPSAS
jgi:hypothetical protein